jgi:hypothetical protein
MWRSPELESLFGDPLDETGLHEAALDRLIESGAREGELLEFKGGAVWADGCSSLIVSRVCRDGMV